MYGKPNHSVSKLEVSPGAKILFIDDDPIFRAMVRRAANFQNLFVSIASSLKEIRPMAVPRLFDVVVVDYFLDNLKENLTGTEIASALEATPVLLVSYSDLVCANDDPWPSSIRKFVHKRLGATTILKEALKLCAHSKKSQAE